MKNYRRDAVDKFRKYEASSVSEYWLVDPVEKEIEIYSLQDGAYRQVEQSAVLNGIQLPADKVFADVFPD